MNVVQALASLVIALTVGAATMAPAQASDVGFKVQGKHGSLSFHVGGGHPAPRPVAYAPRDWVPSHYETVQERVWVPGHEERVWIAPVYEWRYDACGRAIRVCVQPGYWNTICTSGHYETRPRQVWVEGGWRARPCAY
jgi:hypothetical protein